MKFLNHLTLGQYVPADSVIHSLDPRVKITGTILLLAGVFLVGHPVSFLLWGAVCLLLAAGSRLPFGMVLGTVRPVILLIVFTSVIHLFFTAGEPIFSWKIVTVTREGVDMALRMGLRLFLLVLFAGMLTLTTSPTELSDGIEKLCSPVARLGFPAHELAMMMTIALRFIPTLLDETDRIMKAQIARGADLDRGGLLKRLRAFIPVLVPLFVIVFQRADDLATAMEARNYRGGAGRTRMRPLRWSLKDSLALATVMLLVALCVWLDRSWMV